MTWRLAHWAATLGDGQRPCAECHTSRRLGRQETERAERLYLIFCLLGERILLAVRYESQSHISRHTAVDKLILILVLDECATVLTGIPVNA